MNEYWLQADWPAPDNVQAGVTLRSGGLSTGAYVSMNLATHVGDDPLAVQQNRQRLKQGLSLPAEPLWLQQVHGKNAVDIAQVSTTVQADAAYSLQKNQVCAVLTADCLPVLLCNQAASSCAAVHAGWRGLLGGVLENTVQQLPASELLAWLGPAIGAQKFEVGEEVRRAYLDKSIAFDAAFKAAHNEGKWLADIYQLAVITLHRVGVTRIYGGGFCTMSDSENFFSYRRDGNTGRMASLIWLT